MSLGRHQCCRPGQARYDRTGSERERGPAYQNNLGGKMRMEDLLLVTLIVLPLSSRPNTLSPSLRASEFLSGATDFDRSLTEA